MSKSNKIRSIVTLRQTLKRWRRNARVAAKAGGAAPSDVPVGHVAVCVGPNHKRFIVRATYLNHPIFKNLLVEAGEEYGFSHDGPLTIPCHESVFEEILQVVSRSEQIRKCGEDERRNEVRFFGDAIAAMPLLHG